MLQENVEPVSVFIACQHQWRRDMRGNRLSLEYPALESAMRMMDIENVKDTFTKLQTLESAVLKVEEEAQERT